MPRLTLPCPATLRSVRLLMAGCVLLCGTQAMAQSTTYPDPLAPRLQTDPRNPPRFRQFARPALAQLGPPPANFTAPASGAGDTGFDSTNARKKTKGKANAKAPAVQRAVAPGLPAPVTLSPYQKPVTDSGAAFAQAPGAPPVELGPIRSPPKKRKARSESDDPYAPLGVHAGSFTLFPAIELIGGYDTNPARVPGAPGAKLYTVAPELQAQSNWSRHELKLDLRGSYTGYSPDETPTLSRPNVNGKLDGRIDVTHDTRVDFGGRALVSTDNPGSPNLQAGLAKLPIFTTFGATGGLGQRFNRLDLSLKGDVERTVYQDSTLTDGSTASNKDRQYNQYGSKLRGSYELSPGVKPFVEFDADTRVHDLNVDAFGYQRDSKGWTALAGGAFELTRLLTGEIGAGYAQRTYQDPRLEPIKGLVGEASLIWTANALTTVKLTANSTINESTIPGVSGVFSREAGLQVDHAFRRWLVGTLKFGAGVDSYKGSAVDPADLSLLCGCVVSTPGGTAADRVDNWYSLGVGLTYKLNPSLWIKGEVDQKWLRSNVTGVDYSSTVFLLGLRLQR